MGGGKSMIQFAYPEFGLLLLCLPALVYYFLPPLKGVHGDALRVPFLKDLQAITLKAGGLWKSGRYGAGQFSKVSKYLLFIIYVLLAVAVARPRWVGEPVKIKNEGRDILLVLDISTSMLEQDFSWQGKRLSRLQALKLAASEFIDKRQEDRIGLILFGTRAYQQAPLTFDKEAVKNILFSMDAGMAGNSTSIGDALGLALKSLREDKKNDQKKDNKIIILLSDGENNDGSLSLPQVINLAKNENIKIYTIGVGNSANFIQSILSYKIALPGGVDEAGLKAIADEAGGRYFRAEDTDGLLKIYEAINQLEPQSIEDNFVQKIKEYYYIPLLMALGLSFLLMIIRRRKA